MMSGLRDRLLLLAAVLMASSAPGAQEPIEVVMTTDEGSIRIELYLEKAPVTVENFLRYVDGEHYDGATFYRTVTYENDNGDPKIEVIQGGIGNAAPFAPIAHEDTEQTGIAHTDGVISMARGEIGTASSEFFVVLGDQPGLDKGRKRNPDGQGFAAFGRVIEGMDVVRKIHALPADAPSESPYTVGQIIGEPVVIRSVRRAVGEL